MTGNKRRTVDAHHGGPDLGAGSFFTYSGVNFASELETRPGGHRHAPQPGPPGILAYGGLYQAAPGITRRMNSSNIGTVNAVSP